MSGSSSVVRGALWVRPCLVLTAELSTGPPSTFQMPTERCREGTWERSVQGNPDLTPTKISAFSHIFNE